MRIFKTRAFSKWAAKEGLGDDALLSAVGEIELGLVDADLGGHVVKKRVSLAGRGKRGGARTLLAYRVGDKAFFVYGFAKNSRANISDDELKGLKRLATEMLGYNGRVLSSLVESGVLIGVTKNG